MSRITMINKAREMEAIDMFKGFQDFINELQQLKQNPVATIAKYKYNIPQGMNDANQITQYLLNTGQKTQEDVNKIAQSGDIQFIQRMFGNR